MASGAAGTGELSWSPVAAAPAPVVVYSAPAAPAIASAPAAPAVALAAAAPPPPPEVSEELLEAAATTLSDAAITSAVDAALAPLASGSAGSEPLAAAAGDVLVSATELLLAEVDGSAGLEPAASLPGDSDVRVALAPASGVTSGGSTGTGGDAATEAAEAPAIGTGGSSSTIASAPDILIDAASDPGAARGPPPAGVQTSGSTISIAVEGEELVVVIDGVASRQPLAGVAGITISGTPGDDLFEIATPVPVAISLLAGAGNDRLAGPSSDATWTIAGPGSGTVGLVSFSGFEDLTGAAGNEDTFVLRAGRRDRGHHRRRRRRLRHARAERHTRLGPLGSRRSQLREPHRRRDADRVRGPRAHRDLRPRASSWMRRARR